MLFKRFFKKFYKKREKVNKFLIFVILILGGFIFGANYQALPELFSNFSIARLLVRENISANELKKALNSKNFVFINVHTPYEGEIEKTNAFIEYDSIKANASLLPKEKNSRIILYCKSGKMSKEALSTLKSMGYWNVSHLVGGMDAWQKEGYPLLNLTNLPEKVLPKEGFELPVSWESYGPTLLSLGVIDYNKFIQAVQLTDSQKEILTRGSSQKIKIDMADGQFVVDFLWALGLAQRSIVYEEGPLGKEYKETAGNFASTGGWTLARGDAVNYLNKYSLIPLTADQQQKVGEIAKNVFRPCCGNSTWFPDCNHGMAALAGIELMVSANLPEEEIYKNILKLNSFWFPQNYLTAATYFERNGTKWEDVDPKLVLGQDYSSAKGAAEVYKKVGQLPYDTSGAGGSCGA